MATYTGLGTENSPYLIETPEQFRDAFKDSATAFHHYAVIQNIDMGGMAIGGYNQVRAKIDGKGHVISNAVHAESYLCYRWWGYLKNIHIIMGHKTTSKKIRYFAQSDANGAAIENVRLVFTNTFYNWATFNMNMEGMVSVIVNEDAGNGRKTYWCTGAKNAKVDVTAHDTDPASYPGIDDTIWDVTGGGVPVLIPQGGDYSQYTHVMGKTMIDGVPKSRNVRAVSADRHSLIAEATSGADGSFDVGTTPYTHGILVYAFDDYGETIQPGAVYNVDDIVHPKTGNGYRYVCVQTGTTGDPLPDWPWPTDQLTTGTAIFNAEKIVQPFLHGPVTPVPIFQPISNE
ncbi:hypothetical protein [Parendozoicomonas sp. Alg238-R29]|uniref:hypothetical protein n=1 Tax=Parendozoicomonas sp. Alg238-R29 TaxID=2993446 RepID=UPI00248D476D|nr:hypothetical protein [Parendozoicomonas sp. Alg238-R29]